MENQKKVDTIKFAIATDKNGKIQKEHFGDASKFMLYEFSNNEIEFLTEISNVYKNEDEKHSHGSRKKGNSIVNLLKNNLVDCIVSQQFGKNIKIVNKHFIPVIVDKDEPSEIIGYLKAKSKYFRSDICKKLPENKFYDLRIRNAE